jgi:hypothetical protein
VKTRYWKRTHKYREELPKSVKQALAIDRNKETSLWKDKNEREILSSEMMTMGPARRSAVTGSEPSITTGFKTSAPSHTHHGRIELNARFGS